MPKKAFPDVIKNLQIFSGVSEKDRDMFLSKGVMVYCRRGDYLFHHGDQVKFFYIICSGLIQLFTETPDGKELTVDVVITGRTIARPEALNPFSLHHQLSAKSVGDSVVLKFPIEWLKEVAGHPVFALNILSAISQYAHMVEIEREHKSTMTAAQQVGCFLQRLCVMHNLNPNGFELPYSKILIASRLGMEPETFSRALAKLKENGVEVRDNLVKFHDIDHMGEYVCGRCSISRDCPTHMVIAEQDDKNNVQIC